LEISDFKKGGERNTGPESPTNLQVGKLATQEIDSGIDGWVNFWDAGKEDYGDRQDACPTL
jgi:hypothetical protein